MIPPKALEKIQQRIDRIGAWRYAHVADVPLSIAETFEHFRTPPKLPYKAAPLGTPWGREWGTAWFRGRMRIPNSCKGRPVYFRMLTWGEMLLYVNGKPFAGMDHKHQEVLLTPRATGREEFDIHVEAYAGHRIPNLEPLDSSLNYHQSISAPSRELPLKLEASELVAERQHATCLFYDAYVLYKTALGLDLNSLRRAAIVDTLNNALDLVPMHWKSEGELETSARAAVRMLKPLLARRNAPTTPTVGVVGHTHIDVGWLWPVRESIRKSARSFSTMLRLMEQYPEMTFLQSQPILLEMVETHYPSLLPKIKEMVKSGRWQPNSGFWLEPDTNVTGGESLVRQLLEGRKTTERLFGYAPDTLWLPDAFGFSAALPQLLKRSEIRNFVTSKLNWNDTNPFPYSTFDWRGIDGSEVFAHLITLFEQAYNADIDPLVAREAWDRVKLKENQDSVVCSIGYGDGGGGVTREMCERMRRMRDLEGCPKTEFVNLSHYLRRLREQKKEMPAWVGELYLEVHRGTLTTQSRTKRFNRKLEFLLRDVEFLSTLGMMFGLEYPAAAIHHNWHALLTNQFHDILPGSSIRKIYETAENEYEQMTRDLTALRDKALAEMGQRLNVEPGADRGNHPTTYAVPNSLSWHRTGIVFLEAEGIPCSADGNPLGFQVMNSGKRRSLAVEVPMEALSVTAFACRKDGVHCRPLSPFKFADRTLTTPHYRIRFDAAGRISSLYDKESSREIVRKGRRLNDLYTADDIPVFWDAWDIDRHYRKTIRHQDRLISKRVVANGPLLFTLRLHYAVGRHSTLTQDVTFYAHSRRIDFATQVDWRETHTLLKVGFPVDIHADSCRHEIQFGHVVRPAHTNTSFEQARFETCAHKWVDISENGYGVAILNDCKYGHDTLDEMISISLLRSPISPDEQADRGRHQFTYAILPHAGDFSVEQVVREAYSLNVPAACIQIPKAKGASKSVGFCTVSNPNVIVESVKKAEDGDSFIMRLYEAGNSRGPVTCRFGFPVSAVEECNLVERQRTRIRVENDSITFAIKPFEIRTFVVQKQ